MARTRGARVGRMWCVVAVEGADHTLECVAPQICFRMGGMSLQDQQATIRLHSGGVSSVPLVLARSTNSASEYRGDNQVVNIAHYHLRPYLSRW